MSIYIIVARYNENIEWTKNFSNVIIYNKGINLNIFNEIMLNNVGREGHTYYKYICDNYDNLPDYNVFLQGNPFDHSPNIINNLNNYIHSDSKFDFVFLSENIVYSSLHMESVINVECKNIYENWEKVFGIKSENDECIFGAGAQFIVSKNKILQHPKCFYENIVKILEYHSNPFEGHDIERFHKYIFN